MVMILMMLMKKMMVTGEVNDDDGNGCHYAELDALCNMLPISPH